MTSSIFQNPEPVLATAAKLLASEGLHQAASLLKCSQATFEQTGYDNWNGGTDIYTLWLKVDPSVYADLGTKRSTTEKQIQERLTPIVKQFSSDWFSVTIAPLVTEDANWREAQVGILRTSRVAAVDSFRLLKLPWSGDLPEVEFLGRLYDLDALPSNDHRFKTAAGDIWKHRVANPEDWPDDWIFNDKRFSLLDGPDEAFLRFLCETVHPAVRSTRQDSLALIEVFNSALRQAEWRIIESDPIAGFVRFVPQRVATAHAVAMSRAHSVADALSAGWMAREIRRMELAVDSDPSLAIGTAKDLVESCCKTILDRLQVPISKSADLPQLVRLVTQQLNLIPDNIPESAKGAERIRILLSNLSQLTQNLAEIRGLYGSGHGRAGDYRGLESRHARLAVGAAATFIDFVTATFHQRETVRAKKSTNSSPS